MLLGVRLDRLPERGVARVPHPVVAPRLQVAELDVRHAEALAQLDRGLLSISADHPPPESLDTGAASAAGAQAILWLRALHASGDTGTYWNYHIAQEHQRNHLNRYQTTFDLAA